LLRRRLLLLFLRLLRLRQRLRLLRSPLLLPLLLRRRPRTSRLRQQGTPAPSASGPQRRRASLRCHGPGARLARLAQFWDLRHKGNPMRRFGARTQRAPRRRAGAAWPDQTSKSIH
jgi:hypothetical protein